MFEAVAKNTVQSHLCLESLQSVVGDQPPQTAVPSCLKGPTSSAAISEIGSMVSRGKLFVCLLTAWELMLNEENESMSKGDRVSHMDNIIKNINVQCPTTFPSKVVQVLEKWAGGANIRAVMP